MSAEKVKGGKIKVHAAPDGTTGVDSHFHVYTYDVFNKRFLAGRTFETAEKAATFQRHEQERIYLYQEADPELFDLPFISSDPDLLARIERDAAYRQKLTTELISEARSRAKRR